MDPEKFYSRHKYKLLRQKWWMRRSNLELNILICLSFDKLRKKSQVTVDKNFILKLRK
jgi:hypothetical protein